MGQSCFPDPTWFPDCRIDTIIAGHTHRPVYENLSLTERMLLKCGKRTDKIEQKFKADNSYYNTGSCVHPRCIIGVEIIGSGKDMAISLMKAIEAHMRSRNLKTRKAVTVAQVAGGQRG